VEQFDKWNDIKKKTNLMQFKLGIKPREIFWAKIGINIGDEEYGKGKEFVRPVVIIRQLTKDLFIGIPTTTAKKDNNDYFHNICYIDKTNKVINSTVMILQQRVFSKKRLLSKIGTVDKKEFEYIVEKLKRLIDPT
jgi:mRNA interferase MazF